MKRSFILNLCSWRLFPLSGANAAKTLCLVATVILFQVLDSGTMVALRASEKDQANRQGTDARYATTSLIADYVRRAGKPYRGEMRVIRPSALPTSIPCKRVQVGLRMGYKPNVRQLSTGELIMLNFHTHGETQGLSDGSVAEHIVMHRSKDNGITWISNHVQNVYGREPYLNVLSHDVMLATGHVLTADVNNPTKKLTCVIHRSTDGGTTWSDTTLWMEEPTYPVFSPGSEWLSWSWVRNTQGLPLVETATGRFRFVAEATRPQAVDFSPDGSHVYAAGGTATLSSALVVANVATTVVDTILPLPDRALAIQVDPVTPRVLLVTQDGDRAIHLLIFNLPTLELVGDLVAPADPALCGGAPCYGGVVSADPRGTAYFTPGWGPTILDFDLLP